MDRSGTTSIVENYTKFILKQKYLKCDTRNTDCKEELCANPIQNIKSI